MTPVPRVYILFRLEVLCGDAAAKRSMSTIEKAASKLGQVKEMNLVTPAKPKPDPAETSLHGFCEIDKERLAANHFLVPGDGSSQLAAEMRRIKRPLFMDIKRGYARHDVGPPPNVIMVTSSLPGEGKTYTSTNLAISMAAELDRRVLLIDADIAKRDLTRFLELEEHSGLSDILREDSRYPSDYVLKTNIDRLEVMPCGSGSDQIDELYASDTMERLIRQLSAEDESRVVVLDSPPILATTEASVLTHHAGQVLLVVEANQTPRDAVMNACSQLPEGLEPKLVLNKSRSDSGDSYGYGYGYGQTA